MVTAKADSRVRAATFTLLQFSVASAAPTYANECIKCDRNTRKETNGKDANHIPTQAKL